MLERNTVQGLKTHHGRSAFHDLPVGHVDSAIGPAGEIFVVRDDQDGLLSFFGVSGR